MRVIECEQGSGVWLKARLGRITASCIVDLTAKLKRKDGEAAARANYRLELIAERLTGLAEENYNSREMQWGTEQETFARAEYELHTGKLVDQVGFVLHPRFDFAGASPDGLISTDGGLEIKAPKTTTHLAWIMAGVVPEEHRPQMLWCMACCEREWWDFMSFDPRLPKDLQKFIVRLPRDEKRIAEIEQEVEAFNAEIEQVIAGIPRMALPMPKQDESLVETLQQMVEPMSDAEYINAMTDDIFGKDDVSLTP